MKSEYEKSPKQDTKKIAFIEFESEEERKQHKQIKLIPKILWEDRTLFGKKCPESFIELLSSNLSLVLNNLTTNPFSDNFSPNALLGWICCLVRNPVGQEAELIHLAHTLKISIKDVFSVACRLHPKEGIEDLIAEIVKGIIDNPTAFSIKQAFTTACEADCEYVFNSVVKKHLSQTDIQDLFVEACTNGNVLVVKAILKSSDHALEKLNLIRHDDYLSYRRAIENNHTKVLKQLEQKELGLLDDLDKNNKQNAFSLFKLSLNQKHFKVPVYLNDKFPALLFYTPDDKTSYLELMTLAGESGCIDVLKLFSTHLFSTIEEDDYALVRAVADNDHCIRSQDSKVINYLLEQFESSPDTKQSIEKYYRLQKNMNNYCVAAQKGHVDVMVRLKRELGEELFGELMLLNKSQVIRESHTYKDNAFQYLLFHKAFRENAQVLANAGDKRCQMALKDYNKAQQTHVKLNASYKINEERLFAAITALEAYGHTISGDNASVEMSNYAKNLATSLRTMATNYIAVKKEQDPSNLDSASKVNEARMLFTNTLEGGYQAMNAHRNELDLFGYKIELWRLLKEIAVAATLVGLVATAIKYGLTGETFFGPTQTNRQKQARAIGDAFDTLLKGPAPESIELQII